MGDLTVFFYEKSGKRLNSKAIFLAIVVMVFYLRFPIVFSIKSKQRFSKFRNLILIISVSVDKFITKTRFRKRVTFFLVTILTG